MKTVKGIVIKGKGKGAEFGFPTANIFLKEKIESGVYFGRVRFGGADYRAALFILPGGETLEAHILDFSGDLYGKEISVEIGEKMREAIKFKNEEELTGRVKKDISEIRENFWK
ncbi:MAG: riboflavin kinase [Patescibacteria group bacterium]